MATSLSDSFTDADGTALDSHAPETGGTWIKHGSYSTGAMLIDNANRVREASTNTSLYYNDADPGADSYAISAVLTMVSALQNIGVCGRVDTGAITFYLLRWTSSPMRWELYKFVNGTATSLGTWNEGLSAGNTRTLELRLDTASQRAFIAGTERITASDEAITARGKVGIREGSNGSSTSTTGLRLDDLLVTYVGGTNAAMLAVVAPGTGAAGNAALAAVRNVEIAAAVASALGAAFGGTMTGSAPAMGGTMSAAVALGIGTALAAALDASGNAALTGAAAVGLGQGPAATLSGAALFAAEVAPAVAQGIAAQLSAGTDVQLVAVPASGTAQALVASLNATGSAALLAAVAQALATGHAALLTGEGRMDGETAVALGEALDAALRSVGSAPRLRLPTGAALVHNGRTHVLLLATVPGRVILQPDEN